MFDRKFNTFKLIRDFSHGVSWLSCSFLKAQEEELPNLVSYADFRLITQRIGKLLSSFPNLAMASDMRWGFINHSPYKTKRRGVLKYLV